MPKDLDLPPFLDSCRLSHSQALQATVGDGTRIGTGFATSEPHSFYAGLWDHIQAADLTDLEIRQALFMAPHPLLVGEALSHRSDDDAETGSGTLSILGRLRRQLVALIEKAESLNALIDHYEELAERRIRFVSGFLGPAVNTIVPDSALMKAVYPEWAGRNLARSGILDWQSIHFPDAPEALLYDDEGHPEIDLFVLVMTPPDGSGRLSHGISNGSNAETLEAALASEEMRILLYLNPEYPFTEGHPESPNTMEAGRLRPAAESGRLTVVVDEGKLPALPPEAFEGTSDRERAIAEHVANHIETRRQLTWGRALQVGIGGTGVLAVKMLAESAWRGRSYTEMLEPFMLGLFDAGKLEGSHFVLGDGRRQELDGKLVCTFTLGQEGTDFYRRLDRNPDILLSAASRVVIPEAFYGGMGINNILGIDFLGHVNSSGRDKNPYSGVGGAAMILRGLGVGGVSYLCLKSTHRTPEGDERSSIFPFLPEGTPVSVIGPDIWGTRTGAHTFLVTEHGVARINARSQGEYIRSLLSVAHPDHRDRLRKAAWEAYRV